MARITLSDIAAEAGLSKYAVSRALSGKSGVSEDTRALVTKVAERLGYQRAPAPGRNVLGAVFDDTDRVNGELHMQIQSGLQREAEKLGYAVRLRWMHDADDLQTMARECRALLIVGSHDPDALARAYAVGKPIVRSGWINPLEPVDTVGGTDREAGVAVAAYLVKRGHREIVFVHGEQMLRGRSERLHGLREGAEVRPEVVIHDMAWDARSSFGQELDGLLRRDGRPTAFFCAHDGLALTVMSELLSRGMRIPADASVIGFGDFSAAQQIRPALTTVKVFGERFGAAAVRQLDARLRAPNFPSFAMRIRIPNEIVERASVGAAPQHSPPRSQNPSGGSSARSNAQF